MGLLAQSVVINQLFIGDRKTGWQYVVMFLNINLQTRITVSYQWGRFGTSTQALSHGLGVKLF